MYKIKSVQTLVVLSFISGIIYRKVFFYNQNLMVDLIFDSLLVVMLLAFSEFIFRALTVDSVRIISKAIRYIKSI